MRTHHFLIIVASALFAFALFHALYVGIRSDRYTYPVEITVNGARAGNMEVRAETAGGESRTADRDGSSRYSFSDTLITALQIHPNEARDSSSDTVTVHIGKRSYIVDAGDIEHGENLSISYPMSWVPYLGSIANLRWGLLTVELLGSVIAALALLFTLSRLRHKWGRYYLLFGSFGVVALSLLAGVGAPAFLTSIFFWLFLLSAVHAWEFTRNATQRQSANAEARDSRITIAVFTLLIVVLAANVFIGLDQRPFHQDENLHVSAAAGYQRTGEFVRWDFLNEQPRENYQRNYELTWLVAKSFDLFGISEPVARAPNGIVALGVAALLAAFMWRVLGSALGALLAVYLVSVNDVVIYFARFVRGYMVLMFLTAVVLFLCWWLAERSRRPVSGAALFVAAFGVFLVAVRFHATAVFQVPMIVVAGLAFLVRKYPVSQYKALYVGSIFAAGFVVLAGLGMIPFIELPFGVSSQVNLSFDPTDPSFAYFSHIVQPYNIPWYALLLLPFLLPRLWRAHPYGLFVLTVGLFFPLFSSVYFFDRYEDFRYMSAIQPLMIVMFSLTALSVFKEVKTVTGRLRIPAQRGVNVALALVFLLLAPIQVPGVPEIPPVIRSAQADWVGVEGIRIHRRAAQPDNHTAYDYIFNDAGRKLTLIRLCNDGINWFDSYYVSQYLERYPEVDLNFMWMDCEGQIEERFRSDSSPDEYRTYDSLAQIERPFYLVASIPRRLPAEAREYIERHGTDISARTGVVRGSYGSEEPEPDEYFPQVWRVQE